jgi:predicted alpha/beta hydrolase
MVGAQSGYWGHWSGFPRLGLFALWHLGIPAVSHLLGYFPSRLLRMGEDLPAGVALEWARWGRRRDYVAGAENGRWRAGFDALRAPLRAYSFSDDHFAPRAAVQGLLSFFRNAAVEHRHLRPADVGAPRVGHWGFFREGFKETLWRESAGWLRARAEGSDS